MSEYLQSELPAIELFKKLGYKYFDAKGEMYEVVLELVKKVFIGTLIARLIIYDILTKGKIMELLLVGSLVLVKFYLKGFDYLFEALGLKDIEKIELGIRL